jgi:hypothetical protein
MRSEFGANAEWMICLNCPLLQSHYVITRERILCSIKCQNMRINMHSNPLKYALLIQNMQVYRIT